MQYNPVRPKRRMGATMRFLDAVPPTPVDDDALYLLTKRDIEHSPNKIGVFRVHFGGEISEKYRRAILIFNVEPPVISGLHRLD